jgi:hypothetical protein
MDLLIHNAILWLESGYEIPWLATEPVTGTVPADTGTTMVQVFFDTLNYQPGEFLADLIARSNEPYKSDLQVPVTMTVEPTASMGWVEGTITDLRTGEPLEATLIAYGEPYMVSSDAESGEYQFWLEQGTYTVEVSAPGYVTHTVSVEITAQQGITHDIALLLNAPWMQLSTNRLTSTQYVDETVTQTLVLTNAGTTQFNFELLIGAGTPFHIVSDENWRVSSILEPGWETLTFDDSSWEYSVSPAPVNCGYINCWSDPEVPTMWSEIQHTTIYLRHSFHVGRGVISATIKTECDDDHDLYINGILVASDWNGYAGPTIVTDIKDRLHPGINVIAIKASDTYGGCRTMCVDATIFVEEIDWLNVDPTSGTIPAGASIPFQVTFDATDLQPDIYSATLNIHSNDPINPLVQVPVTMTIITHPEFWHFFPLIPNDSTSSHATPISSHPVLFILGVGLVGFMLRNGVVVKYQKREE